MLYAAAAFSALVAAAPSEHQASALGLYNPATANSTQHIRMAVISPGNADGAIFNALCTMGLPTTHLTKTCSTYEPMIGTNKKCAYQHTKLDAATQAATFPAATRALEVNAELETCAKMSQGGTTPKSCQIGVWTNNYRDAAVKLHESPLSGAGAPFQGYSMFWSDMRPKATQHDKWFFVYSHRDAHEWAKDRINAHGTFPVCNVKNSKIASMTDDDMSPLDPFACLFFCIYNKIADETDNVNKCVTTLADLGPELAAKAYKQHTEVALRVAKESFKTPVLELNLWSGEGMNNIELQKTIKQFLVRSTPGKRKNEDAFSVPCQHGTDSKPTDSLLKASADDDENIADAEPYMTELVELRHQLMNMKIEASY